MESKKSAEKCLCPVKVIKIQGLQLGPLFIHGDDSFQTRHQFSTVLRKTLQYCGLDPGKFGTHSFRIGAATLAAAKGFGPWQVQAIGH